MIYRDLVIVPGGDAEVTQSGDAKDAAQALTVGRWIGRAVMSSPGDLVHRPLFGAGIPSYLGLPRVAAMAASARSAKRAIERNPDVLACRVTATQAQDYASGTVSLEIDVALRSGVRNTFGLVV